MKKLMLLCTFLAGFAFVGMSQSEVVEQSTETKTEVKKECSSTKAKKGCCSSKGKASAEAAVGSADAKAAVAMDETTAKKGKKKGCCSSKDGKKSCSSKKGSASADAQDIKKDDSKFQANSTLVPVNSVQEEAVKKEKK